MRKFTLTRETDETGQITLRIKDPDGRLVFDSQDSCPSSTKLWQGWLGLPLTGELRSLDMEGTHVIGLGNFRLNITVERSMNAHEADLCEYRDWLQNVANTILRWSRSLKKEETVEMSIED